MTLILRPDIPRPTRGLLNCNPGNLVFNAHVPWRGLTGADGKGFCIFRDDFHGLRAIARDLRTDYFRDGQRTIAELIGEYAPPNENNTLAYIGFVVRNLGVAADREIALTPATAAAIVAAIVRMENGVQPYPPELIAAAIADGLA
ncbi:MAG: hypothetical protein RLZZ501_351 [Pseudomonadota bacterium]